MRMAGRFARRVRASAAANGIPVHRVPGRRTQAPHRGGVPGERTWWSPGVPNPGGPGPGAVWKVNRTRAGKIPNLEKTREFVNHYSFHIMDPTFGHLTIKMSGHPPFGAQVILNGHEYVACAARAAGIPFAKEGNCFTRVEHPQRLAQGRGT